MHINDKTAEVKKNNIEQVYQHRSALKLFEFYLGMIVFKLIFILHTDIRVNTCTQRYVDNFEKFTIYRV